MLTRFSFVLVICFIVGVAPLRSPIPLHAQELGASSVGSDAATKGDAAVGDSPTPDAGDPTTVTQPVPPQISVDDVTSDDAIQNRLTEILSATEWFQDVDVQVRDSVVFLGGRSTQEDQKKWAGQLARNTQGVAAVVNRMKVERSVDVSQTLSVVHSSLDTLMQDFLERTPLIIAGVIALVLTWLVSRIGAYIVRRSVSRSRIRAGLKDLLAQLTTIAVWTTGLMIAAVIVFPGMTPAKVLTVLGLSSVAVGFAFKDIFENFFAGILILWRYPFDKGDFIECEGMQGRIENITIRNALIRQVDGQLVVVPNAMLFKNPVEILTSKPSRRVTVICGVSYDTNLKLARNVIKEAVESCASVSKQHPVEIFAQEFAGSSIRV